MQGADRSVFYWINGWPDTFEWLFRFLSEGTKGWPLRIVLAGIVVGMIIRGGRARTAVLLALVAWPIANEVTDILKNTLQMARPSVELADAIIRGPRLTSFGTASAHSANMMAVATVFLMMLGRWGWIWFVVAILTGISRIYVGVHYPSQVLFGWMCGAFIAWVVVETYRAYLRVRENRAPEPPDEVPEGVA